MTEVQKPGGSLGLLLKKIIIAILLICAALILLGTTAEAMVQKEWDYYYSDRGEDYFWLYQSQERYIYVVWIKRTLASDKVSPGGVRTILYQLGFDFQRQLVTRYMTKTYTTDGYEEEKPDYLNRWIPIKHSPEYIQQLAPWVLRRAEFQY